MSVLISGMNIPELDEKTEHLWIPGWIEISRDGKAVFCTGTVFDSNAMKSYPITDIPTQHGKPIDAKSVLDFINHLTKDNKTKIVKLCACRGISLSEFSEKMARMINAVADLVTYIAQTDFSELEDGEELDR